MSTAVCACSPTLDWRDVRPAGTALLLQFPCRPADQVRRVPLAGRQLALRLDACQAGGLTWALSSVDVGDLARVDEVLGAMRQLSVAHIRGTERQATPLRLAGSTASPGALRMSLSGQRPDGAVVEMRLALFARGTQVFQAAVLGRQVPEDVAEIFLSSLRLERSPR